jgi:hypothetical protein
MVMENPFVIDWDQEKKQLLKRDYRVVCFCVALAFIILLLAYFISSRFGDKDITIDVSFLYMVSIGTGIFAVACYINTRALGKEMQHPAMSKEYEELLDLSHKYYIAVAQCREAVVKLLERQGHITGWQVNWLIQDLKKLGIENAWRL